MRVVYRVFAILIAVEVVIQAMAMVFAIAGLGKWVDDGGVLDKAVLESDESAFSEAVGFAIHGINGMMIIPALALLFLIISFFAKVPNGIKLALVTFLLVVLQVTLGILGHDIPFLGALHGLNAFLIVGTTITAARMTRSPGMSASGQAVTTTA